MPGRGDSVGHVALPAAGKEPALYWGHAREAAGRDRPPAEGVGYAGQDAKVAKRLTNLVARLK